MISFHSDISGISLPEKFTFPFAYEPHPIAELAAKELQQALPLNMGIGGKMYGVLVVQNEKGKLSYLAAFSGQDEEPTTSVVFTPSIFDRLQREDFYKQGEEALRAENRAIDAIENSSDYQRSLLALKEARSNSVLEIETQRKANKEAKANRKALREQAELSGDQSLLTQLEHQSIQDHYAFKELKKNWREQIELLENELASFQLDERKRARKQQSIRLQQRLFDQYQFLNKDKAPKSLLSIFPDTPPSGAGDCAAPKLLQHAFQQNLKPIALAEFWWGRSPKAQLRKHLHYYPACSGKCKPILAHMLEGITLDDDPARLHSSDDKHIDVLFDDEHIAVIQKPEGLLSVPSKQNTDSVLTRMQKRYPTATGNIVAHRLDWHTSGLMIIVKTEDLYKNIQAQFAKRTVRKKYIAILDGELKEKEGKISLPLIPDIDNRPRQMVSQELGKPSETIWEVLSVHKGQTRIAFTPLTGRTHQLRVHAAHPEGLNAPIVGDRLYGTKSSRMHLHAAAISFIHPVTQEEMSFEYAPAF